MTQPFGYGNDHCPSPDQLRNHVEKNFEVCN